MASTSKQKKSGGSKVKKQIVTKAAAKAVKTVEPKGTSSPKPAAAAKKVKNSTAIHNPSKAMRANGWEIIQVWVKPPVKAGLRKQAAAEGAKLAEVVRDVLGEAADKFVAQLSAKAAKAAEKAEKKVASAKPVAKKAVKSKKAGAGKKVEPSEDVISEEASADETVANDAAFDGE